MPVISAYKRQRIIEMSQEGTSQREISRKIQVSLHGVQGVLQRAKKGYGLKNLPKNGRPRKISRRTLSNLIITSKRKPKLTARQLKIECNVPTTISIDTVKRRLRENDLMGRVACKKPTLTSKHKTNRKNWCNERADWSVQDWKKIIFSDETKIELVPRCREYVRRSKNSNKFNSKFVTSTKKFTPSIMVWGAIRGDGKRVIYKCDQNVDQYYYQALLDKALPNIYTTRFIFQQDGATCHTARSSINYLTNKLVRLLPKWPSQSPDLSIIENLWDMIKEKVRQRNPSDVEELWTFFKQEFEQVPDAYIFKLYESMPRRIRAVRLAKGCSTKY